MVKRKVTCVFGKFDDKSDFVLEPSCPEECKCDICKDTFWIEDINSQQIKKDKDDGSNVSLSGDTKQRHGKDNKVEHMHVDATHLSNPVDNQSADNPFKYKCICDWSKDDEYGFIPNTECPVHGKETKLRLSKTVPIRNEEVNK